MSDPSSNGVVDPSAAKLKVAENKFQKVMSEYVTVCSQLGELEYHFQHVMPRRRKELLQQATNLQKQANQWQTVINQATEAQAVRDAAAALPVQPGKPSDLS